MIRTIEALSQIKQFLNFVIPVNPKMSKMKVLVCDADAVLLSAIEFRLRKYGFDMVQTTLKEIPKMAASHQPDLIIIDTENTPAASVAFLQSLKKDQPELPVIMISPLEDEEELWKAMQYGADDFVTKPFKLIELVLRVRKLLNRPESSDGTFRINI